MNRQQNAEQTQLVQQEGLTLEMLDQTLDVLGEQNNAVQAEFAITLLQAQNTIQNLQNAQQALLLENAQSRAQITVLESQNNQMNAAHQADRRAALERNDRLERENARLRKTIEIHERGFINLDAAYNQFKRDTENWYYTYEGYSFTYPEGPIDLQIAKTKQELRSLSMEEF
jgi:hypothetical protein